ncbi:MAG: DUF4738 domain-containing protein [Prevotellaceae bacterium]|nr:DUF4738 domain-containing protein [Prevotellaceae bacterium]
MKTYLLPAAALLALTACSGKTGDSNTETTDSTSVATGVPAGPMSDKPHKVETEVSLGGHTYALTVSRTVATARPAVKDWEGDEYYDNICEIDIRRDGEAFACRSFTLDDFQSGLDEATRKGARLLGMAYDSERSDAGRLMFGAQVGQAGMDGGPAFCVAFSTTTGEVSIAPDAQQDTEGGEIGD